MLYSTAVASWDVTPCSPVDVHRSFGVTYCLHLQNRRVSQTNGQQEATKYNAAMNRLSKPRKYFGTTWR
jgi:hypothetical protein